MRKDNYKNKQIGKLEVFYRSEGYKVTLLGVEFFYVAQHYMHYSKTCSMCDQAVHFANMRFRIETYCGALRQKCMNLVHGICMKACH